MAISLQVHYTDRDGYKAIGAQPDWVFKASDPPGDHPRGAYFTTLRPDERNLAQRLRIPKRKVAFAFCFNDSGDLVPLPGGRGQYIFFSRDDYKVGPERQVAHGSRGDVVQQLREES